MEVANDGGSRGTLDLDQAHYRERTARHAKASERVPPRFRVAENTSVHIVAEQVVFFASISVSTSVQRIPLSCKQAARPSSRPALGRRKHGEPMVRLRQSIQPGRPPPEPMFPAAAVCDLLPDGRSKVAVGSCCLVLAVSFTAESIDAVWLRGGIGNLVCACREGGSSAACHHVPVCRDAKFLTRAPVPVSRCTKWVMPHAAKSLEVASISRDRHSFSFDHLRLAARGWAPQQRALPPTGMRIDG
eukprot:842361-Prymnesium_polylepis.2